MSEQVNGRLPAESLIREGEIAQSKAASRIGMLLDSGSFVEIGGLSKADGQASGVVCGYGAVMGTPVAVFSQDSTANAGAVGAIHAKKIQKVYELALKTGIPVIGIYDSIGARISEGVGALDAYGRILKDVNNLSGVVPQISLVLGTCAGVAALLACSADIVVMSDRAELFVSACGNDEAAATAQAAAKSGVAHIVCADDLAACNKAKQLLCMLPINNLASLPAFEFTEPDTTVTNSVSAPEMIEALCDRNSVLTLLDEFGNPACTALATLGGTPCGIVYTGGEMLGRDACAKIAKLVSFCDSFQIPVVTLVNSDGLSSCVQNELSSSIRDMARMAHVYAEATTAKATVITGNAFGAVYIALCSANSDYTLAWPSAVISPLQPKTAVAFLHGDDISAQLSREQLEADYIKNDASPYRAAADGHIDDVIDPADTRAAVVSVLDLLSAKRVNSNPKKHSNMPM